MEPDKPKAFDFFCGIGGFSLGLIQAGFEVVGAMDISPEAAYTYMVNLGSFPIQIHYTSLKYQKILTDYFEKLFKKKNVKERFAPAVSGSGWISSERENGNYHPPVKHFFFGDVMEVSGEWILEQLGISIGELDLVVGGPPCQGFSKANQKAHPNDPRNKLVFEFARKVVEMQPTTFAMEEVPDIVNFVTPEGIPVIDAMCMIFEEGGFGTFDALKKSILATAGVGMARRNSSFGEKKKLKTKEPKPKEQLELF